MDEVAEIKNRLEIAEVVGAYLPLKQAGRNLKAPCPFHAEKTASFMVSPEKGIYHCFGCHEGGDIFSFIMKMEGVEFREALEKLARQAGVELKTRRGEDVEAKRRRERLLEAHELAVRYFQASLMQNSAALDYVIQKRGLRRQTVKEFQIGYAPDAWNALTDFLVSKGFTSQELLQAGLAGQKSGRNTVYDLFRGRIMFTICDREGRPRGFTGRVLDDSLPKYLNTPQTELYDKSEIVFGFHLAKEAIRREGKVILVEGNMDVIASHQAGVENIIAASGTAITRRQLQPLKNLAKQIILAFDSDRAGLAATKKVVPLAVELGLEVFALQITDAKDADELIAKDRQLWIDAIARAKEIRDYWLDRGLEENDIKTTSGRYNFVRLMAEVARLYQSTDSVEERYGNKGINLAQEVFLERVSEVSSIDLSKFKDYLANRSEDMETPGGRRGSVPGGESEEASPRAKVQSEGRPGARIQLEKLMLGLVLSYPLTRISLNDLSEHDFSLPEHQAIYRALKNQRDEPGEALAATLTDHGQAINILLLVGERQYADVAPADRSIEAFELARRLRTASNHDLKQILTSQLREAQKQGDVQLELSLLGQLQAINEEEV